MSDISTSDMRTDDFPLDLVSLQLDDYDVVQQQANDQLKGQLTPQRHEHHLQHLPLPHQEAPPDEHMLDSASLLQGSDLLLHTQLLSQFETFQPGINGAAFEGLRIDTSVEGDDVAMDIQQFPTPTGSPARGLCIEIGGAGAGYETPLTVSPGSTPSTTPGTTPYNTPGHTPGVTPGHTPGVTPGSSPPGPSPHMSPCSSHPSSPRSHKGHMLMMRGLASLTSSPYVTPASGSQHKEGKPVKIPRHKRPSHIHAEQRRRSKIQLGFDELTNMIPAISEISQSSSKDSKSSMLTKTVDYCRQTRSEYKELANEADLIRKEIEQLTGEIKIYQSQLPAAGVAVKQKQSTATTNSRCAEMFEEYLKAQSRVNWKFWIFGSVIRPLFETYNASVTTSTSDEFSRSVITWLEEHLTLTNLRPAVFNALRHLSTRTSVMDAPERLPEEAMVLSQGALITTPKVEPVSPRGSSSNSSGSPSNPPSPLVPSR